MTPLRLLRIGLIPVLLLGLMLGHLSVGTRAQAPAAPDAEDLQRGVTAIYSTDTDRVVRIEPTIALSLRAGEAPHPRIGAGVTDYHYRAYLNLLRAGKYRFSANLRGSVIVTVGKVEVLKGEALEADALLREGPEVELPSGVHALNVVFKRPVGAARLELLWQGPGFRREPLPPDFVGREKVQGVVTDDVLQDRQDQGRYLVEEHSCVKCHSAEGSKVGATLGHRPGPDLSKVGGRVHPGWIEKWLESPHALQPAAVMPKLFGDDDAGKAERHAVSRYLVALGGKVPDAGAVAPKDAGKRLGAGEKLYHSVGCVVCHGDYPSGAGKGPSIYPLTGLGSKTTPEKIAEFLGDPLKVNPSGRMPHLALNGEEARDIAWFLSQSTIPNLAKTLSARPGQDALESAFENVDPRADELADWKKLNAEQQLLELGKRSVVARGCNNCHKIEPEGQPFASVLAEDLVRIAEPDHRTKGCLSANPAANKTPRFALDDEQRKLIGEFLRDGLKGVGSPAPAFHARVALQRFNCLACHQRDGEGGLTTALIEDLRKYEKPENAETLSPPSLNGVGHKLRTSTMRGVLLQASRVRAYMGLRMPQFGEANVGGLAEGLALLEGTVPDDAVHKVELTTAKLAAGRDLAGKAGFGCASCHDMAGVANTGTRGPDLALTPSRIRYDWYLRWLEQPQRMQVGTKMPAVFTGGKSLVDKILDGHADRQAEAMWAYFSLGTNMPLPEGLEPPKGMIVGVGTTPVILRTFLPEAGSRAIALGYPGNISAAYDAHSARLAFAWTGNFIDATPVWGGRGGNPAKILGPRFWTAPAGCPIGVSENDDPPDFALRAKDPAYGAHVPVDQIYTGERLLRFGGFSIGQTGEPTFRYEVDGPGGAVHVSEFIKAERAASGLGLQRTFSLDVSKGRTGWIVLGESTSEPQLVDATGTTKKLDLAGGKAVLSSKEGALVTALDGERVQVVSVKADAAKLRVQKFGPTWQILAQIIGDGKPQTIDVRLWQPYRNEPALLKELLGR